MEEPALATAERRVAIETEVPRRDIVSAVNEASYNLGFEADVLRNHERLGHTLSADQQRILQDYWNFKDIRKEVLRGKDGSLPEDLKSDTHYLRFEDLKNPSGTGIIMEEGIPVEGLLRYLDRTIERRSSLPPEHANLDHYLRLKQIILDNSKSFKDLYFPGMSEEDLKGDPAFYARVVYGARQWVRKHPEEAYDIGNWVADERERLLQRRELTMPIEIETDQPPMEPTTTPRPVTYKEQPLSADLPRVIWRNGIKIIWKKREVADEPRLVVEEARLRVETPRAKVDVEESTDRKFAEKADRLSGTHYGRSLRVDPRLLLVLAGIIGASAVLHGGEPKQMIEAVPKLIDISGPVYGPGKPLEPLGGFRGKGPDIESFDFGEEGHSLNGLAVAIGAYLDNQEQVRDARARGEVYTPDLEAKMKELGVATLPPDDPDLIEVVQRAEKEVPWWSKFITYFKNSARLFTYDPKTFEPSIEGDRLPQKVSVVDPKTTWEISKQEDQMERGMLADEQL